MKASTAHRAWVAGALTAVVLGAGCSSTVGGSGRVGTTAAPSTRSSRDFPSGSIGPITSAPPSAGGPASGSTPASPGSSGASAPSTAAAPAACASQSDCKLVKSWNVGGGFLVAVFSAPSASSGVGAAVLMLARDEVPVFWHVIDGETPSELLCKVAGGSAPLRNCVLVDYVGAHAATAYPLVVDGDQLDLGSSIGTDTPGLHAADLDHDLLVDAYGLNNDYKPDYASGHVQWQTWQRSADGATLKSTGCGPLSASPPKAPTTFVTGNCVSG